MPLSAFFDKQRTAPLPSLPLYYRLLRRWETSRVETASRLLPPGRYLFDVGCGEGGLVRLVAGRYRFIVAADVSPVALKRASQLASANGVDGRVCWLQWDANNTSPFEDGAFSAVACMSMIQYLFDPEEFLREIARILSPSGSFVLEVPNMAYLPQRLRLLVGKPIQTSLSSLGIDGGNLHYFTVRTIKQLLRTAGFKIRRVTGSGVLAPLRSWWVSLLSGDIVILAEKS